MEAFFVVGKRNAFSFYFALNFLILCRLPQVAMLHHLRLWPLLV
jgi:hypothetical protein